MDGTVLLNDISLSYEVDGQGEPVLFIHGSFIADTFKPLLPEPSLSGYKVVTYHRRGYRASSRAGRVLSISEQSADALGLLRHLGIERAHVVGHSFGGVVALQLALEAPETVGTLTLIEPALAVGASGEAYKASLTNAIQRFRAVGAAIVVDEFLEARWPGYRPKLDKILPGSFQQAVTDAPSTFVCELPGLLDWTFDQGQASRINQPVLSILGGDSDALSPRFAETHRALCEWLPHAEGFSVPDTTHFLQVEKPRATAEAIASFLTRHALKV